jgi:hypothetical protein
LTTTRVAFGAGCKEGRNTIALKNIPGGTVIKGYKENIYHIYIEGQKVLKNALLYDGIVNKTEKRALFQLIFCLKSRLEIMFFFSLKPRL